MIQSGGEKMADQITVETKPNPDNMLDPTTSFRIVKETFEKITEVASVDAVYAEPIRNGDVIVVPSAEVLGVVAFGAGTGGGKDQNDNRGGGGGAGGRMSMDRSAPMGGGMEEPPVEPITDDDIPF
jgi:hypothetical protein